MNSVGVDVNLASAPLLTRVAGLSASNARNIVAHREQHGAFGDRDGSVRCRASGRRPLNNVRAFTHSGRCQSAGRQRGASGELCAGAKIIERAKKPLSELLGNGAA